LETKMAGLLARMCRIATGASPRAGHINLGILNL
jgi:hypothetical protein